MAEIESPLILSDAQKKEMMQIVQKKKEAFDEKLVKLMLAEDMVVLPVLKYTTRGVLTSLDFEPMSKDVRAAMEARSK